MKQWQKLIREVTRTPGPIRVQLFLLTTLTASSVLSTGLQIYRTVDNTSEENTSIKSVNPLAVREELQKSLTGSGITEALMNLNETLKSMVNKYSEEKL